MKTLINNPKVGTVVNMADTTQRSKPERLELPSDHCEPRWALWALMVAAIVGCWVMDYINPAILDHIGGFK